MMPWKLFVAIWEPSELNAIRELQGDVPRAEPEPVSSKT